MHKVSFLVLVVSVLPLSFTSASEEDDYASFLERSRRAAIQNVDWQEIDVSPADEFIVVEGEWELDGTTWSAVEGEQHRAILIAPWRGDSVRIEFEALMQTASDNARIGDITVLLATTADDAFFSSGYALTTGSFWNQCSTFYRRGKILARTEYSPVLKGEINKVVLEFHDGHIRYWLNGEIILEANDPSPLPAGENRYIGLRTWDTDMTIRNLRQFCPRAAGQQN